MAVDGLVMALRAENRFLRQQVAALTDELAAARERIIELEQGKKAQPSSVKPNRRRQAGRKGPRRKRRPEQNGARRREQPTRVVTHKLDECPKCACRLHGDSIARRRQVIDLPAPQPVEVTEHRVIKRRCPKCGRWHVPRLDLRGQVLGQGRLGVRLASLIAYLRTVHRLPVRLIKEYLQTVHQASVSTGEVVEVLHRLQQEAQPALKSLREELRGSAIVHGDETGWREDGRNGYVWSFSTPGKDPVRYYERHASRAGAVVRRVLGRGFEGVLSSDFYAAYNEHKGQHQRCWVHLLRDLRELREEHPGDEVVLQWAQGVRALHDEAQEFLKVPAPPSQAEREARYADLLARLQPLGLAYAREKRHPCQALAKRLLRHQDELFQFVRVDGLRADNNLAERSLRPVVVTRKVSGGTRSSRGSDTRMALASLFGTWQARDLNPLSECFRVLSQSP